MLLAANLSGCTWLLPVTLILKAPLPPKQSKYFPPYPPHCPWLFLLPFLTTILLHLLCPPCPCNDQCLDHIQGTHSSHSASLTGPWVVGI